MDGTVHRQSMYHKLETAEIVDRSDLLAKLYSVVECRLLLRQRISGLFHGRVCVTDRSKLRQDSGMPFSIYFSSFRNCTTHQAIFLIWTVKSTITRDLEFQKPKRKSIY